ncbi:MAG: GDSL-type esterase/lipase family protein [Ferruginibacter sp.]
MSRSLLFILFVICGTASVYAQGFAGEIANFKKQDSLRFPVKDQLLFVGSSSFRKWENVQESFPSFPIINRRFGGSALPDVIYYEKEIIFPYHPRQVVIYAGENDIAASDTITAQVVFKRFKTLYTDIRKLMPDVPVLFVSIKPSPSRWAQRDRQKEANEFIKNYIDPLPYTAFVNIWNAMLDAEGNPTAEIFMEDKLHMNDKGYAIWQRMMQPYLVK